MHSGDLEGAALEFVNLIGHKVCEIHGATPAIKPLPKNAPFPHKRRKKKTKVWFDQELKDLKSKTNRLANQKHANPNDSDIKEEHKASLKLYKIKMKEKKTAHRHEIFTPIKNSLNDSGEFWKKIKNLVKPECLINPLMITSNHRNGKITLKNFTQKIVIKIFHLL